MISPLPHQVEAIKAAVKGLTRSNRAHMVMACGAGKTLTSMWIAEKLKPTSIVIFVPSLALINQFMKSWVEHLPWQEYKMLAICGDDTVTNGLEEESLLHEDIKFPVTRSFTEIHSFLNCKTRAIKIIFCTYQSSALLWGAKIDLGIFDEAHKTAGYGKEQFSFAVSEDNLKIKKRLFMTATPRHSNINRLDSDGNPISLYSMDDEKIYGKRVYSLTFRDAIDQELICPYKIIISVAKDNTHEFNKNFEYQEKAIALQKAINDSNATKVVCYHRSIMDAKLFAKYLNSSNIIHNFKSLHVNGGQSIEERQTAMDDFKNGKNRIICNSRCLTEGVDIPAIDMVAFLNPRSSKIDIVQAIGRALRHSPGKEYGYIFLPLFIDPNLPEEEAVSNSEFSHIWEVLNAISEQDAELNDIIKNIGIKGTEENFVSSDLSSFVQFNLDGDKFERLRNLIAIKLIKKFQDSWSEEKIYLAMKEYKAKYKTAKVKRLNDPILYRRMMHLKDKYQLQGYRSEYINKIAKLGFNFEDKRIPVMDKWDELYPQLKEYAKNAKKPLSISRTGDNPKLGRWCIDLRKARNENRLSAERIKLLDELHFDWDPYETLWQQRLLEYKIKTKSNKELGRNLVDWTHTQRTAYLEKKLSPEREKMLRDIGFDLEKQYIKEERFSFKKHPITLHPKYPEILAYFKRYKTWKIPVTHDLYNVIKHIRLRYSNSDLHVKTIAMLNKLKFPWRPDSKQARHIIRAKEDESVSAF